MLEKPLQGWTGGYYPRASMLTFLWAWGPDSALHRVFHLNYNSRLH